VGGGRGEGQLPLDAAGEATQKSRYQNHFITNEHKSEYDIFLQ